MAKNLSRLRKIYDKTDGRCHICYRKLSFKNHGIHGARGSWHVDHSRARSRGGSDHGNDLFPACIDCNLDKGTLTSCTARMHAGTTRAPYSKKKKIKIRENNMLTGVISGGIIGAGVAGPPGFVVGAILGGMIGDEVSPKI
jgi:5-methylcytosine-specific restriction endonuclease McrA